MFDYRPGIYGIMEDGQLMGVVENNGDVSFPFLADATQLIGNDGSMSIAALQTGH